jgi:protein gp37
VSAGSKIQWTDHSFNPWWGCVEVSPGCDHCYAKTFAKRVGEDSWGESGRRFFGEKHWAEPLKWTGRVFCASMADVFEMNHSLDAERERLFDLIEATPQLTWQILTKRPENIARLIRQSWVDVASGPANIWLGTSVEDQTRGNLRVRRLVDAPILATRFLSVEPLLESVDLNLGGIEWVIIGCESGPGARPFELGWARDIVALCRSEGIACFVKQLPGQRRGSVLHDLEDFPADLRIREYPR